MVSTKAAEGSLHPLPLYTTFGMASSYPLLPTHIEDENALLFQYIQGEFRLKVAEFWL